MRRLISNQNDWFVFHRRNPSKGTLILKNNTFQNNIKYSTETLPIYICDCVKMLLTVMLYDEYESKVLTLLDTSFLFPNHEDRLILEIQL